MKNKPLLRIRLLDRILPSHQALVGDLEYTYRELACSEGEGRASTWLWARMFTTVPYVVFYDLIWGRHMFKNYLTVALRQIRKYRAYSAINILGLAFSLAVCLLILSVIHEQGSYDEFHPDADRIYRLTSKTTSVWGSYWLATSSPEVGQELRDEDLGVEALVQLRRAGARLVRDDGRMATFSGVYASSGFFDMFGFRLSDGDRHSALSGPRKIVLSEELAEQLFPDRDPIGEMLTYGDYGSYTVSGVLATMPEETHLRFEALVSFDTMESLIAEGHDIPLDSWTDNYQFYNYFKLGPDANAASLRQVADRLGAVHHEDADLPAPIYDLQKITSVNLGKDLSNEISGVVPVGFAIGLSVMALVLVLMAVFNYVNLTTARSMRRVHEIGIRKVVGAHRRQLFQQFVSEAVLTTLVSLGIALLILQWLIPQFNALTSLQDEGPGIQVDGLTTGLILRFVGLSVALGVLAGLIPALRLSGLATVRVLKGAVDAVRRRRISLRKSLTVLQFAVSIIAIVLTVTLFRQASYVVQVDYGFNQAQLMHLELQGMEYERVSSALSPIGGIELVAGTSDAPSVGSHTQTGIRTPEMEDPLPISTYSADEHFIEQYAIDLLAGRNFSPDMPTDEDESILITTSALDLLQLSNMDEALGLEVRFNDRPATIVGVVEDFYATGFEDGFRPVAIDFRPENIRFAAVRIAPVDIPGTLEGIENTWTALAPGLPVAWTFFDDQMNERYAEWRDVVRMLGFFAFLIVFIASLGLLGMASFTAETRLREVGIRKVLGADVRQVVSLLSKDYVILVLVAIAIAAPVSFILADRILAFSANHVELGPLTILAGVAPVLILSLLTIGSQTLRAAVSNPAEVIRDE